jgi:hypothetical protein
MINSKLLKNFATALDDLVDWQKFIHNAIISNLAEIGDGYLFSYGLGYLNETYGDKIPEKFLPEIEKALQCFIDKDYIGMLNAIPEGLNDVFEIKAFDHDFQGAWLAMNFNAAVKFALYYAEKKKAE